MSFTTKIVLGLVLGVITGLFFGEIAAPFVIVGEWGGGGLKIGHYDINKYISFHL